MSRPGNPYDNAQADSFTKCPKHEEMYLLPYRSMDNLMAQLPGYLEESYDRSRLHSALGYRSPAEFEVQHSTAREA